MKRITIHYEGLDDDLALLYAREALYKSKERKGLLIRHDGVSILFSDRSKHLSLTIKKNNG